MKSNSFKLLTLISILIFSINFSYAALILQCPADSNVSYQPGCQYTLGDYTSTVVVLESDGTTFFSQSPVSGTIITATTTVTVTVTDTGGNIQTCSFDIVLPPTAAIKFAPTDASCFNGNDGFISSTVTGGTPPYTYLWTNGETNSMATGLTAGSYGLTVTDANGCQSLEETNVGQPTEVVLTGSALEYAGGANVSVSGATDGSITTTVTGGTPPYVWSWTSGDTTQNIDSLGIGIYKVIVTDNNGCIDTMEFELTSPFDVVIPKGFSPNGDGINDVFEIYKLSDYPDNKLIIFNRWGEIVYKASPYNNDWNGTNNTSNQFINNELPDGTYFYHFTIDDSHTPVLKGYVILKRK